MVARPLALAVAEVVKVNEGGTRLQHKISVCGLLLTVRNTSHKQNVLCVTHAPRVLASGALRAVRASAFATTMADKENKQSPKGRVRYACACRCAPLLRRARKHHVQVSQTPGTVAVAMGRAQQQCPEVRLHNGPDCGIWEPRRHAYACTRDACVNVAASTFDRSTCSSVPTSCCTPQRICVGAMCGSVQDSNGCRRCSSSV